MNELTENQQKVLDVVDAKHEERMNNGGRTAPVYASEPGSKDGHNDVTVTDYNDKPSWTNNREEHFVYVNDKTKKDKRFRKIVLAGCLAGIVALSGISIFNSLQHHNFEEATKPVHVIGLQPEVYDNNNLVVRANGDASFFNNETGQFFNEYNGENADELAQNYTNEGGRTLRPSK